MKKPNRKAVPYTGVKIDQTIADAVEHANVITVIITPDGEPHILTDLPMPVQLEVLRDVVNLLEVNIIRMSLDLEELVENGSK